MISPPMRLKNFFIKKIHSNRLLYNPIKDNKYNDAFDLLL